MRIFFLSQMILGNESQLYTAQSGSSENCMKKLLFPSGTLTSCKQRTVAHRNIHQNLRPLQTFRVTGSDYISSIKSQEAMMPKQKNC